MMKATEDSDVACLKKLTETDFQNTQRNPDEEQSKKIWNKESYVIT